jgi:hypothetical protein
MKYDVTILEHQNKDNLIVDARKIKMTTSGDSGIVKPKKPKTPTTKDMLKEILTRLGKVEGILDYNTKIGILKSPC